MVASGVLTAVAGIILVARQSGVAQGNIGPEYLLPALTAAFLGSTTIKPGRERAGHHPRCLHRHHRNFGLDAAAAGAILPGAALQRAHTGDCHHHCLAGRLAAGVSPCPATSDLHALNISKSRAMLPASSNERK
jgi:hypothetical protein